MLTCHANLDRFTPTWTCVCTTLGMIKHAWPNNMLTCIALATIRSDWTNTRTDLGPHVPEHKPTCVGMGTDSGSTLAHTKADLNQPTQMIKPTYADVRPYIDVAAPCVQEELRLYMAMVVRMQCSICGVCSPSRTHRACCTRKSSWIRHVLKTASPYPTRPGHCANSSPTPNQRFTTRKAHERERIDQTSNFSFYNHAVHPSNRCLGEVRPISA